METVTFKFPTFKIIWGENQTSVYILRIAAQGLYNVRELSLLQHCVLYSVVIWAKTAIVCVCVSVCFLFKY